ncbi:MULTISPECIES: PLD nuclease N-terminal domain-containing protein [Streptococcaceae]|uniref:PLD nuclease N-terminal domain-containing protein n=1 Tax=Streptococcaceae TaxID=1300 RepID=UPI002181FB68|nr:MULTISPECIES: PLD nuclease N-terminal domain-containing protein [Lactococcus]MBR3119177.1 PLDc_N domain-containing protein [Oceanobacillus sp.]MCT0506096.1 PLDc_N domain-containing protein [Lactococcus cremoris]MDR9868063.1 PLD nuclease N-terminal domain-containing protein [Lactococcus cremoris]
MVENLANLFGISLELAQVIMPILVIHCILALIALIDLIKNWKVRVVPFLWLVVVVMFNLIGPVLYFIIGRKQKHGER